MHAGRIVVAALALSALGCGRGDSQPRAVKGVLQLQPGAFDEGRVVSLKGEWAFYWRTFVPPEAFADGSAPAPDAYASVPGEWPSVKLGEKPIPRFGYATYRLRVRLPDTQRPSRLGVITAVIGSAHVLYVDGREVERNGRPGPDRQSASFARDPHSPSEGPLAVFDPRGAELDLVVHVSNYEMTRSGLVMAPQLGAPAQLAITRMRGNGLSMLAFGAVTAIGLYFLVLGFLRRRDAVALPFAGMCLAFALRAAMNPEAGTAHLLPSVGFIAIVKLATAGYFLAAATTFHYWHVLFPRDFNRWVMWLLKGFNALMVLPTLILPLHVTSGLVLPSMPLVVLGLLYGLGGLVVAAVRKREGAALVAVALVILMGTTFNDMLHFKGIISTAFIGTYGVLAFIILQAVLLSARLTRAFAAVETMSGELEQKNTQLLTLDKLKDEFLANTSHELRTPLHGITNLTEALLEGAQGPLGAAQQKQLQMVHASSRRLGSLVNDLLDFSKIKHEDVTLRQGAVDVRAAVEVVLQPCRFIVGEKPVELVNGVALDTPLVRADEDRLEQILYNLIGNGIKFTEQGKVEVTAEQRGGDVAISVRDTGIGIPKHRLEAIFRSFEQGDGAAAREYGGTGLGLSITQRLVELHHGTIEAASTVNQGSTFTVTLPIAPKGQRATTAEVRSAAAERVAAAEQRAQRGTMPAGAPPSAQAGSFLVAANDTSSREADAPAPGSATGSGEFTILAVDDDPINLEVLSNYLGTQRYRLERATGGAHALEILRQTSVDLMLVDIMMPRMSGYDLCRQVRARFPLREFPLIFVSARTQPEDLLAGFQAGASDYLTKPFSKVELLSRIKLHLELATLNLDTVTGIANRRCFDAALPREWQHAHRGKTHLAVMMIDIDHFKLYNDTYGHQKGDDCLREVAAAIATALRRGGDLAARYGGEEFVCLLQDADPDGALALAEGVRRSVAALQIEHRASKTADHLTISVGVASTQPHLGDLGGTPEALVKQADQALYRAKAKRNSVVAGVVAVP